MEKKTIRLIFPQWQGGNIARWIQGIPEKESSRGYYLDAMLLDFIATKTCEKTYSVPVTTDISKRLEADGILDRDIISAQTNKFAIRTAAAKEITL